MLGYRRHSAIERAIGYAPSMYYRHGRFFRAYLAVSMIAAATGASCSERTKERPPPENLQECLLRASEHGAADAIIVSQRVCNQVFGANEEKPQVKKGDAVWFFTIGGTCRAVAVKPDWSVSDVSMQCYEAKFEQPETAALRFLCRPLRSPRMVVYELDATSSNSEVLQLKVVAGVHPGFDTGVAVTFFRSESACEMYTPEADRTYSRQLASENQKKNVPVDGGSKERVDGGYSRDYYESALRELWFEQHLGIARSYNEWAATLGSDAGVN